MKIETYASEQLKTAEYISQADEHVKNVLAIKPFLARIIKGTVRETAGFTAEQIEEMIEGDPQISIVPVDPGYTNNPRIRGETNEDLVPFEGEIKPGFP